ncbi:inhibitor of apoptosis protein [Aphelenchoides avenae]|nr:inhibitor of apoptosis protein [Aphelenchus avenae]
MVKIKEEKIHQQESLLHNQSDLEKRLDFANRRMEDLVKELQIREAEITSHIADYDILQRHCDTERRKAEEMRISLMNEVSRLVRSNEQLSKEVAALQTEIAIKDEALHSVAEPRAEMQRLNMEIERLQEDNRELSERHAQGPTCGVCMDKKREVIFMPCLHFTCCKNCAESMDHCSICRLRIMGKIEFFQ